MPADSPQKSLTTERLTLRPQKDTDAVVFRLLWTERDERAPPHRRIDADGRPNVDDIVRYIREERERERPGLLTVVLRETEEVIGYCGVVFDPNGDPADPELVFELLRAMHNRGLATEAGRAVITCMRESGFPRLRANVWDWNATSRHVLGKLGFVEVGTITKESAHGSSLLMVRDEGKAQA
ncbi:GNAT family N-acetyltransferase [Jeongeupia chitinilytica]|uniref:N-acetyltransferase n=1 Tax=Jeongeupia chitinilytica TaxID=1041641 RepID=A0ABQ3H0D2_9NEIS|nr:GNAT family N-acetyltransferase [Jeongeupia chitinilytica]GHD59579.1 N-acetyltransferase [Jeongeupia chitinilytica]